MTVENVLQRLDKVRKTGAFKWQACCPAHDNSGPSLAIREMDDGRVLLHCLLDLLMAPRRLA
jgi:DNA primase